MTQKLLWKYLYWLTCIGAGVLAFVIIGLTVAWYHRGDGWQTFLFVLSGCGFYTLLCFQHRALRIIGAVGILFWSVIAWLVGYIYAGANTPVSPRIGPIVYQIELIYAASVPFVLLFLVFVLLSYRRDIVGN